ncbi:MAG: HAD family hydrolase [Erysipelotrichaceae bacterium]|nr:HAD family hydrolase [Erysipelotrichaceae bacterium]
MDKKYKGLVVCDIDNTLVVKHEPLTAASKEVIDELKKEGWLFGLASGRAVYQVHVLEKQWDIKCDLIIGINGCEMYDGLDDKFEMLYDMKPEWVKEAIDIMKDFDTTPCLAIGEKWISKNTGPDAYLSKKYLKEDPNLIVTDDLSPYIGEPVSKICFRTKEEDMPEIEAHAVQFKNDKYKTVKTEKNMFEFCNINASKGNLMKIFCDRHNIDLKDVWAFGDMSNDIDMIEMAGNGVCMLNGSDETKAAADYISEKTINDDGFAYFTRNHIL